MRLENPSDGQELRKCPVCGYESHTKRICPNQKGNCGQFVYLSTVKSVNATQ